MVNVASLFSDSTCPVVTYVPAQALRIMGLSCTIDVPEAKETIRFLRHKCLEPLPNGLGLLSDPIGWDHAVRLTGPIPDGQTK
jgi:hypothetical protein